MRQDRDLTFSIVLRKKTVLRLVALGALLLLVPQVNAQQATSLPKDSTAADIEKFCTNIADSARDQRYLLQKQELEKLQADVDERIAVLEKRKTEYEQWLKVRNEFMAKADAGLVEIFKTMKADAAAPQLEKMRLELAAAIIMKLPARQSGLILSEMDPQKAGQISMIMSSASDPNTSKDRRT